MEVLKNDNLDTLTVQHVCYCIVKILITEIISIGNKRQNQTYADIQIAREMRQGRVLSPFPFNMYSEGVFRETLDEARDGLVVDGRYINNIGYAEQTVLLASSKIELQWLLDNAVAENESRG